MHNFDRAGDRSDPIPLVNRDDPGAHSGDVVAENVAALKALFPSIFVEGKVDLDVLRQLLGGDVEDGEERYGLTWKGKKRARAFALTPSLGTLRPAKEDSADWDTTKNIVIEGDNLEVLKLLRKSYAGRVKLIYIDPPYNTGNDFVYPDDYHDSIGNYERLTGQRDAEGISLTSNPETSGRFHTDWLNMIYPRLITAVELLCEDGIIVSHVDEHEVHSFTMLLRDLMGSDNHLGTIVWDKRNPKGDARGVAYQHEYLVVFAKRRDAVLKGGPLQRPKRSADAMLAEAWRAMSEALTVEAARERFKDWIDNQPSLSGGERMYNRLDKDGRVYRLVSMAWPNKSEAPEEYFVPLKHPITGKECPVPERGWRNPPTTMKSLLDAGLIAFGADHTTQPQRIYYLDENMFEKIASVYPYGGSDDALMQKLGIPFDQPKPVSLAASLIQWFSSPDGIILDFFAGSGTAAHATWLQNALDNGRRRYMLVQLPEPLDSSKKEQKTAAKFCDKIKKPRNIAELTKERLRRAGTKIREELSEAEVDTGFRVYKLANSNLKPWQPDPDNLEASLLDAVDNILPNRTEDDLLVELLLKTGIDLTLPGETRTIAGKTVHALGGGVLIVCLGDIAEGEAEKLGQGIGDWRDELDPPRATTFYFNDSGFATAATKANLAAIIRQRLGKTGVEKLASI